MGVGEKKLLVNERCSLTNNLFNYNPFPWQFLYFLPLPHGQGSLRPTLGSAFIGVCPAELDAPPPDAVAPSCCSESESFCVR